MNEANKGRDGVSERESWPEVGCKAMTAAARRKDRNRILGFGKNWIRLDVSPKKALIP